MDEKFEINKHYKMFKAGKTWMFAAVASFAFLGAAGAASHADTHLNFGQSLTASASTENDANNTSANNTSANNTSATPAATNSSADTGGLSDVHFDTLAEAWAGKIIDLPPVTDVAADGSQSLKYQVKNVFVRADPTQNNKLVATYLSGKTTIEVTPEGYNNSVAVQVGPADGSNWTYLKYFFTSDRTSSHKPSDVPEDKMVYLTDTPDSNNAGIARSFTFTTDDPKNNAIQVSYTSSKDAGGDGKAHYYQTPAVNVSTNVGFLEAQQKAAATLKSVYDGQLTKITGDTTLQEDAPTQTAEKNSLDNLFSQATAKLYQDQDQAALDADVTAGTGSLTSVYKPSALPGAKQTAKDSLKATADSVKKEAADDSNLTDAERKSIDDSVDSTLTTQQGDVDQQTTPDAVTTTAAAGYKALLALYSTLPGAQNAAKASLTRTADEVSAKIKADANLTDYEKAGQLGTVSDALDAAEAKVASAKSVADVNSAAADGYKTLLDAYVPGKPAPEVKTVTETKTVQEPAPAAQPAPYYAPTYLPATYYDYEKPASYLPATGKDANATTQNKTGLIAAAIAAVAAGLVVLGLRKKN
ncbi:KxYKxGKxW signal peptide domain-containing protein [Fructobacillus ficulneus]|uniref:Extracellular matrix binding protein n=1 Tax=Fructobacillus ficulneus TaxID=157463 RepID=A0A0K8MJ08_9LACO|nr:KxYKxGKxW signal peptide domain-containing protein [Fructobacillus ficulneus]GAP00164.1 extracellular matrix binding protein [Fructobacillus ficulneus]